MANAAVAVAVKLTIPNKKVHLNERDKLLGIYEELEERIGKLTTDRVQLERNIKNDITNIQTYTLDFAIEAFIDADRKVNNFNEQCQTTQTAIDANNEALQKLLDSITLEITQAKAEKAAKEAAAAAETAAEAAALQKARDSLKEYVTSLQTQLQGIDDNKLDEIMGQIQGHTNTIKQYGAQLDDSVSSAGDAISQATREAIAAFKMNTMAEVTTKTQDFNALNQDFGRAKNTIVTGLDAKIRALQDIAVGAGVTAEAINAALDTDKTKPIEDKNLGEIKDRAARLADDFGKKATTEFATRKADIEGKIEEDKRLFQEKKEITEEFQKIKDIFDSEEFKKKEAAIQNNIVKAKAAEKAELDETQNITQKMLKNAQFGIAITNLNTSILSLERELEGKLKQLNIKNLDAKLKYLQERSAKIQPPSIDLAPIQARLDALNAANHECDSLNVAQLARGTALTAEEEAARSRSSSSTSLSPKQPVTEKNESGRTKQQNILKDPDEKSVPEPKRTPGRRYSIYIPTPKEKKPTHGNSDETEDVVDPTVLEIFVYEDDESETKLGAGAGAGARAGAGGGFIQRGGEGNKVAKIIKVKKITPKIQELFLSFNTPNEVLTTEFLKEIEGLKQSTDVVETPKDIDNEYDKVNVKLKSTKQTLIENTDTRPFFDTLGNKVDHKSTIMNLMKWLDGIISKSSKYENMYGELWRFMDHDDCTTILRTVIKDFENKISSYEIYQGHKETNGKKGLQQILGWTSGNTNTLYDKLLIEISKCEETVSINGKNELRDTGKYSMFIHGRVQNRGYRFMLNWLILVALHVYYNTQDQSQKKILLVRCGEFIEKLHYVFIKWMYDVKRNNSKDADDIFVGKNPKIVYTKNAKKFIQSSIIGDTTVMQIINKMREYMCVQDNSGERGSEDSSTKQIKSKAPKSSGVTSQKLPSSITSDSESESDSESVLVQNPSSVPRPSTPKRLDQSNVFQKISEITQGGVSTMSPSPHQAWMNPAKVGAKTPETPQPSPPSSQPRPPSEELFTRRVKTDTVPQLDIKSIPKQVPQAIQSARDPREFSQKLSDQLQNMFPQSARTSKSTRTSIRPTVVNVDNPATKPSISGGLFPGQFNDKPLNEKLSEGTGDLSLLHQQKEPSKYEVLINPKPTPPQESNKKNGTFHRRTKNGGHKRTRKHRTPASSTPAPATRRHRDHSSSSHKRTRRRQRPQRREH
jgi:hypothetical protein